MAAENQRCLVLIDRGMGGNQAFAQVQKDMGFFTERDYELYREEIGVFDGSLDALLRDRTFKVVYLRCQPETAFARMRKRGNSEEVERYTKRYFKALFDAHEKFLHFREMDIVEWDDDALVDDGTLGKDVVDEVLRTVMATE
jgi:thymidylate kinase